MGGLAGYRRPIRTTGDLTGGGGRSVEAVRRGGDPRRSGLSRAFGRYYGPQEREVPAGGWEPPPPGGGYSGGVVPSFQAGGRTGYAPSSYTSPVDPYGRAWGYKRRHLGKSYDPRERVKSLANTLQNYWGQPPGGGYSGGVIPRFQGGSKIGGQGAAARARGRGRAPARRQQPWTWVPEEGLWGLPNTGDPGYFYTLKQPGQGGAPAYTPGGGGRGGYSGGVIPRFQQGRALTPRAVKRAWGYNRPYDPRDLTRQLASPHQIGNVNAAMQSGRIPHFGPSSGGSWGQPPGGGYSGGVVPSFQAGGQFPEPAFPVESELADESPWYPDEEVGFEEAAPMQGGFDIFGRGGG